MRELDFICLTFLVPDTLCTISTLRSERDVHAFFRAVGIAIVISHLQLDVQIRIIFP